MEGASYRESKLDIKVSNVHLLLQQLEGVAGLRGAHGHEGVEIEQGGREGVEKESESGGPEERGVHEEAEQLGDLEQVGGAEMADGRLHSGESLV